MKFLKRLFCKHEYVKCDTVLEDYIDNDDYGWWMVKAYYNVFRCSKCGKTKKTLISKNY